MAYTFQSTPTATVKGKSADGKEDYTLKGINSSLSSATNTADEINKLLAVYGKTIVADENMKMTITKEAEDDE